MGHLMLLPQHNAEWQIDADTASKWHYLAKAT
jgi:hypothetical protein